MGALRSCGICCMCLSIWAVIQLTLMGVFFNMETPILIHDAEEEDETKEEFNYAKFIDATRKNYAAIGMNCWIAAGAYAVMLFLSYGCVLYANSLQQKEKARMEDDAYVCKPKGSPQPMEVASDIMKPKFTKKNIEKLDEDLDEFEVKKEVPDKPKKTAEEKVPKRK